MGWERPAPTYTPETKPFWDAAAQGRFVVQSCRACSQWQYPYRGFCCHCWSSDIETRQATRGTVFTHSTIFRNDTPGFEDDAPYAVAMVQLDDAGGGLMVMTNIVGCAPEEVHIGMPVQVTFRDSVDGRQIPVFTPRSNDE